MLGSRNEIPFAREGMPPHKGGGDCNGEIRVTINKNVLPMLQNLV